MDATQKRNELFDQMFDLREDLGDKEILDEVLVRMSNDELDELVDHLHRLYQS